MAKNDSSDGLPEFRKLYDKNVIVPDKIRGALEALAKKRSDGTAFLAEVPFLKSAALSTTDLALFREQFAAFYVNVGTERQPKRVWFGTKKAAAAARETVR